MHNRKDGLHFHGRHFLHLVLSLYFQLEAPLLAQSTGSFFPMERAIITFRWIFLVMTVEELLFENLGNVFYLCFLNILIVVGVETQLGFV